MTSSYRNTANIPESGFSPAITQKIPAQRSVSFLRSSWAKFALAASTIVVLGAVAIGIWGNSPFPSTPASPTSVVNELNPADPASLQSFSDAGGIRLTGRIRPVISSDAQSVRATGWVMDIYTFGGGPENLEQTPYVAFEENFLVPIDLTGFDTTKISEEFTSHPLGMLAVVMDTHSNERAIVPARGPYGVMYSDRLLLASSTGDLEDTRTLRTLDGTIIDGSDIQFSSSDLLQFADFQMLHEFDKNPKTDPQIIDATKFESYLNDDAKACIVASSKLGSQILSFPLGSTSSISTLDVPKSTPASSAPQRVVASQKPGDNLDLTKFVLDTGENPNASIRVWPTSKQGSCGDFTGEIVEFAGLNK